MSQSEFYPVLFNIVNSYTRHKIVQRRFSSILQKSIDGEAICPAQFAALAIKFLGEDLAAEFNQKFNAILSTAAADRIIAEHAQLFSDDTYDKSFRVSTVERLPSLVSEMGDVIFKEKQNIGTMGAFLAFGASFAAYCEQKEGLGMAAVEIIVESVVKYLDTNLGSFLKRNGGLSMVQSAKVECVDHFTASRRRKAHFADSLKHVAEHSLQMANPQFYIEMCQLILEIQNLLGMEEKASETFFDYGMFLFGRRNYSGALDALRNALKGFKGSRPAFVGQCHFQMGVINSHIGNFQDALVSFQEALECKDIMFGNGIMSSAICHHWIGYTYRRRWNIDKALEIQSKALQEMEENTRNTTRSFVSDCCFELGCIYHEMGDLNQAKQFHERSLLIREEQVYDFKPTLQSCIHFAAVLMNLKRKGNQTPNEHTDVSSKVVSLLDKAVTLCKEQSQHGNLLDKFPVIMIAHTDRLESIKHLLALALELCEDLLSILEEELGLCTLNQSFILEKEIREGKQKTEKLKMKFRNLQKALVHEDELEHPSNSACNNRQIRDVDIDELHLAGEQVVPPEINLRGQLALEAYRKALSKGKTYVKRVPVMLIGQDRSGKTSLKKSLRGQRFNPDEDSTVGVDVDPSHFKVSTEIWKAGEKDQTTNSEAAISYEQHAARLTLENLQEEKCSPKERVMEATQSGNTLPVDTISANVRENSESNEISSELPSANNHGLGQFSDNTQDAEYTEMSIGVTESFQISRDAESDKSDYVPDIPPVDRSDTTQRREDEFPPTSPKIPDEIETLIKKLLQEVDKVKEEDDIYSVLWDFGGQSVYYATHPLFLTVKAMYLLVFDLGRDPYERARPVVKQGMFKNVEDNFSTKTNLDYLDFWMTSVASLASQDEDHPIHSGPDSEVLPEKIPPVFLVCTHADEPFGGADPYTLAREVFGCLQAKPYKSQLYDDVFVVDNTKSGLESECSEVTRLREKVLAVAKELPQIKEAIPIKWLKYEKALQVAEKEGHKWMSLERAKQIALKVCEIDDDQEFVTLLNFLHDQRILIHFNDTALLNNLVILDPQWLVDVFKRVITVKPYVHESRKFKDLWHKLEVTGILDETLLEHVWSPLIDQRETSESLIAIMEKFSLLCPWPSSDASCSKQYLVPSMLMSHPPKDIIKLVASARIPSLFLKFESGQVPSGFFPRLMLQFFQWGKTEFLSLINPQLYLNFARFYTAGDEDCSVILLCHSSSIEVVVHRGNLCLELAEASQSGLNTCADAHYDAFEVGCARAVRRQLGLMLECMRKEFCWLKNMRYELDVICPVCCQGGVVNYCRTHNRQGCEREECLHFWSESELQRAKRVIVCTKSAAALNNKVKVNQFAPWFATLSEQLAIDEHDGRLSLLSNGENEEKSLALPDRVLESLLSQTCAPNEVVLQLKQSLQLDQASLDQPEPGTKRLIRCLATKAKHSNRLDVVKHLRAIVPAGTTGPLLHEHLDIRKIPVNQMRDLTIHLSGGDEWRQVAEKLGLSSHEIRYLEKRTLNPCDAALAFTAQRCYISVGDLYDVLNNCGLPVIADLL